MKRILTLFAAALTAIVMSAPASSQLAQADGQTILQFETMAPVTGPFVGTANPIRGVPGGGFPWMINQAEGNLQSDGSLQVEVQGLVLARTAPVPPSLQGTNPVKFFRAVVSCLTVNASGSVIHLEVPTAPFPASTTGDSEIEATVSLPRPCVAPIVFVTSPTGAWFAATGQS